MANILGNNGNSDRLYFGGAPKSLQMVTAAMKLKDTCSLKESYDQPRQHYSEKAMAPHSSTLAWKIPWTEEPVGLQSMGLLRVGHD